MLILRDLTSHSVVVPYRNRVHDRGLVNTQVASWKDLAKLSDWCFGRQIKVVIPLACREHSAQRFHEKSVAARPKV